MSYLSFFSILLILQIFYIYSVSHSKCLIYSDRGKQKKENFLIRNEIFLDDSNNPLLPEGNSDEATTMYIMQIRMCARVYEFPVDVTKFRANYEDSQGEYLPGKLDRRSRRVQKLEEEQNKFRGIGRESLLVWTKINLHLLVLIGSERNSKLLRKKKKKF
ncbi:hypothetical protein PUN28_003037 [Cardiocondyla obscurior]|uniref:Uncharacterized protein n=1 Tax=Cardiocondyla obscurior TaxID=286306 RepID=A0AAW2GX65_9HYME